MLRAFTVGIVGVLAACSGGSEATDPPTTTRPEPNACPGETREDLILAVVESPRGLASDVARTITDVTCVGDAAFARVCLLCADANGARFELLFQRSTDGAWMLIGMAEGTAIDAVAEDAGISEAELAVLRNRS